MLPSDILARFGGAAHVDRMALFIVWVENSRCSKGVVYLSIFPGQQHCCRTKERGNSLSTGLPGLYDALIIICCWQVQINYQLTGGEITEFHLK